MTKAWIVISNSGKETTGAPDKFGQRSCNPSTFWAETVSLEELPPHSPNSVTVLSKRVLRYSYLKMENWWKEFSYSYLCQGYTNQPLAYVAVLKSSQWQCCDPQMRVDLSTAVISDLVVKTDLEWKKKKRRKKRRI